MKDIKKIWFIFLVFVSASCIYAQERNDSLVIKTEVKPFVTLYHQHHDFFGNAFSYQGIEGGVIVQRNLYLGVYGAFFVSNLKAEINNKLQYVWIGQGGVHAARVFQPEKRFHLGCELNMGIFTLRYDDENFGLFETGNASFRTNGLIVSPQIFGELIVTDWFNVRTGLSYNFYSIKDHLTIATSDLNHISFTFGLVFHSNKGNKK